MKMITPKNFSDPNIKELLNFIPAGICYVHPDLSLGYYNAAFSTLLNIDNTFTSQETLPALLGIERYHLLEKYILQTLHGEQASFHIPMHSNHSKKHLDITFIPDVAPGGNILGFTFYVAHTNSDTEQLLISNDELKKSEERYHQMIDEVQDYAILLLDEEGNIQNWNKGAEKIKGYTAEEVIGKNFRIFYLPADVEIDLPGRLLNEATINGRAVHEGWRVKKDGSTFWGSIVITALHDTNNHLIGFSKVTRDLTERKMAEANQLILTQNLQASIEKLRRSEERYYKMIEEVQDYAILLLDKDGHILNWNKGAERIKGYKSEEIIGKHFSIFYTEQDKEKGLPQHLLNEASSQGRAHLEGWRLKKDGTAFWGSVVVTALHDTNNHIIGFSKVTRDLTERKTAEDLLKENAAQLESQNKELEQFAYVASHDLQEPLRKIRTFNSLILENEKNLSEKGKQYFERTTAAADRMHKLIDDLLTYSRATRDPSKNEQVDLNQVINQIKSAHKDPEGKNVKITSANLPIVRGMKFQFEQLFDNLISNAIKYQEPGNLPFIEISYEKVTGDKIPSKEFSGASRYHHITVSDNGIGFEQEYADRIFEMFHRLHGKSEFSGSGIGLAICKKIVQNYNGYITANGNPGQGAEFHIYLPA